MRAADIGQDGAFCGVERQGLVLVGDGWSNSNTLIKSQMFHRS